MRTKIFAIVMLLVISSVYAVTNEDLNERFDDAIKKGDYNLTIILGNEIIKNDLKNNEYNKLINDYELVGMALIAKGDVFNQVFNLSASLDYYNKAEQLVNEYYNDKNIIQEFFIRFYGNYGIALLLNGSYSNSELKLLKAYDISKELNKSGDQVQTLANLGRLYSEIGEYNKTIWTVEEREKLSAKVENKEFIMGFAKAILDKESKIDFNEIWDIMSYNSSYYSVKIQLFINNSYRFDFLSPIMDWSFHLFNPYLNYEYKENNIEGEGNPTFSNMVWYNGNDIEKTDLIERVYPYPQQGMKLISNKTKQVNISFLYPKEDLSVFASRNTVLIKDLKVNYEKIINIHTNDEFFSEFPSERRIYEDHYAMYFNKDISGVHPNDLLGFSHSMLSYFPYVDEQNSFGTIFGLKKPSFKRMWLNEIVKLESIDKNQIAGLVTHKERIDFQNKEVLKYIGTRLFFAGDNIRDITIKPIDGIIIKDPISPTLNEYHPQYEENQAYISNKEGETRYLFFWIQSDEDEIDFEINYPIDLSYYLESISEFTWKLHYNNIFYPGKFPLYDRQYKFILPENYQILNSSIEGQKNRNIITFNFEDDFKLKEEISFTFKDLNLERKNIEKNIFNIKITTWILTFLFIITLSLIHYKYKRTRFFLTFLAIPLSFLILSVLDLTKYLPFIIKFKYYYIGICVLLLYGLISYIFYRINSKKVR